MNDFTRANRECCAKSHILVKSFTSDKLIKTVDEYCNAFFHVEESIEANVEDTCLCDKACYRKSVTCIASLRKGEEELYCAKYTNCRNVAMTIHAEHFICNDEELLRLLHLLPSESDEEKRRLTVFMTYQPCHYSGGHGRRSRLSCTELMIDFYKQHLLPRNIKLSLKIAYIYRAHWSRANIEKKYWPMIDSSVCGIQKMSENGIYLNSFSSMDWAFIHSLCTNEVLCALENSCPNSLQSRVQMDTFIAKFLSQYTNHDYAPFLCLDCDHEKVAEEPEYLQSQQHEPLSHSIHLTRLQVN